LVLGIFSIECDGRLLRYQRRFRSMKLPPATKAKFFGGNCCAPFDVRADSCKLSQEIDVSYSNTLLRDAYSSDVFDVRLQITQFDGSLMRRDAKYYESYYINPSFLMDPVIKRLIVVAREHRVHIKVITGLSLEL
jgi:hypothetical protein